MTPQITTQRDLRAAFWEAHRGSACKVNRRGNPVRQNQQCADTRMAWVDFVDAMQKSGVITERLAFRATL